MKIEKEKVVIMHYTLKDDGGQILDSSSGESPLGYIHGSGQIIPGLERELEGQEAGAKINATIHPQDAYGMRDESLVSKVPITQFQDQESVKVGIQFQADTDQGPRIATVTNIEGNEVTMDFNHPLADKTLHFDVEIMEVRDATEEEKAHGHVHGEGGCNH